MAWDVTGQCVIMIQTNAISLIAKGSFWAEVIMDGKEDTIELELTREDSQKYGCEKTNDEVGAQLPVDSLEKK